MGITQNFKLPYPEDNDVANVPGDMKKLAEKADESLKSLIELLYPIGRGFLDFTNTDYSNWLGLTWERELVGMFPVGYNPNDTSFDSVGEKGGEKAHTLTESELPSIAGQVAGVVTYGSYAWGNFTATKENNAIIGSGSAGIHYSTLRFGFGSGQAHNNLPPYQVVAYWKRVDPNAMISFSMYGITYQAEEGMTFGEWVASEYNTDGWEIYTPSSGYITNDTIKSGVTLYLYSASAYYGSGYTKASHLIIADYSYSCYQEK
jgi:hypothetical protein